MSTLSLSPSSTSPLLKKRRSFHFNKALMEFQENNEEEQEEEMNLHDEEEEEEEEIDAVFHKPTSDLTGTTSTGTGTGGGFMVVHGGSGTGNNRFRFRECLKNQAVNIGGHAVDGCGEFMPAGIEGTIDALKCAACGCHRNFHRKELPYFHAPPQNQHQPPPPPPGFYRLPAPVSYRPPAQAPPPLQLALPPPSQRERSEDRMETSSAEAGGGGGMRKRFRTKFTAEQKERMLGLAKRIGWRIQRQDDEVIQRFCSETGISRQVLKVWLHNNKHTLGKSPPPPPPPPSSLHYQNQNPTLPPPYHHEQDQPRNE